MSVRGKRVLVHVDYDCPLRHGKVMDDTRMHRTQKTLKHLIGEKARIILITRLGEPLGKPDPALSVRPLVEPLSKILGVPVFFHGECVGPGAERAAAAVREGQVLLLENIGFHPENAGDDTRFAGELARLADVFIREIPRRDVSARPNGIEALLPSGVGFLALKADVDWLEIYLNAQEPDYRRALAQFALNRDWRLEHVAASAKALRDDTNPVIRHDAAIGLARSRSVEWIPDLLRAADSDDSVLVRHESLGALGELPLTEESRRALEKFLRHPIPELRETARLSLDYHLATSPEQRRILDREAIVGPQPPPLDDPSAALLDQKTPTYARAFAQMLLQRDGDRTLRRAALHARSLREDPSPLLRHVAAATLGQIAGADFIRELTTAFRTDPSVLVRHEALVGLGWAFDAPQALDILESALEDPLEDIRATARIALDFQRRADADERAILTGSLG